MGLSFSCPFSHHCDLDSAFESVLKSITLGNDQPDKFKNQDFDTMISQPSDFGEPLVGTPVSCGSRKGSNLTTDNSMGTIPVPDDGSSLLMNSSCPEHAAALKLQKVYKSFRTRRKLADCAVLIEQTWWKLLDFAELKHSSISFFEIDKHETAISRWSRARTRAAKVGKGLSKNCKARKLALQHWLEAIDPRHRYGHNLHFYYIKWLNSQSKEPFFYWLDIGEGKEVNLIDKCSRWKLQQQCIKYLGPVERKAYKVVVEGGKLVYKQTRELVDTPEDAKGSKWIFVLSATRSLYVGKKAKGSFQHSSFLAGGATLAAGRIVAEKGVLKAVWPHSGHYRPTPENFKDLVSFLQDNNVDLTGVELESTVEDEEGSIMKQKVARLQSNSSEDDLAEKDSELSSMEMASMQEEGNASMKPKGSSTTHDFIRQLTALEIPSNENFLHNLMRESQTGEYTTIEMDENAAAQHEIVPEESILHRINSRKELRSYQLGKQLSCKWSTGAGPRIGCLRDYPSGLQSHALEQVNLSPQRLKLDPLLRASSTPVASNLCRTSSRGSPLQQSSHY